MRKVRVDILLMERGLTESRAQAQRLVRAGQVRVDDQLVQKSSITVLPDARIQIERGPQFVSRGGEKLEPALNKFALTISGKICADLGASTGGFTDCLLQHGANKVDAIDVGKGILHWKLRQNPQVVVMEDTNARYLKQLPEPVQIVTVDASFISLKVLSRRQSHSFGYFRRGFDSSKLEPPSLQIQRTRQNRFNLYFEYSATNQRHERRLT